MDNPLQEHAEAAEHAHEGNKRAALLVAVMAAALALTEQGAKHAEMKVEDTSIAATDAWAQYQAKSTRAAMAKDFAGFMAAMPVPADPVAAGRLAAVHDKLVADQAHYDQGPDGKQGAAQKAHDLEQERDHALVRAASFDNGSALLELAIVLATASVIVSARPLLWLGAALGLAGLIFAALAFFAPAAGAL